MEHVLLAVVKKQNQLLLERIAEDYYKNEEYLKQMYHTPSFYKLRSDRKKYQMDIVKR